ncbi:MAG: fused MFS/spermidine synthase [Microcoleus sp. PH2017_10_PVI_O_A]|uniref:spermidine synthase n=1 Tax=unclassified Microcoleus TaxID=2642155 RepID=UPI001D9298CB|nr:MULTISPECIES: fused MFS/spermidine synthase [unclassified Microcoleus]MCC3409578.1 fused MFS/spermidine synthase [Microcoleus sp. PH2017_10_PVI_O_A]MCC3462313.1 fused MFS/spermidine synthase [Microcoleus sp. PH2017_11_PCY_U_A]MCC3481111.1 fused MFS/spermidine synthase [Microcoleus sp. PH2017_12_PCY_D_A]MCC3563147.1 fused MFS/spermidine synthase [Microcoleus sp. PH2017_27_LUM_O_A]
MIDAQKDWQTINLAKIQQRLAWVQQQPDGVVFCKESGVHYVTLKKDKNQINLSLVEKVNLYTNLLQSVFNLNNPLHLVSEYTQAMMLGLVWQNQPKRVYIAGFGGGRIPLVMHHYLPETVVECADVDAIALAAATQCFGVQFDDRLSVAILDGRKYLEQQSPDMQYDIIMTDVFFGNGYFPHRLATKEFYELCQKHLSTAGVVLVNLLQRDEFYAQKVKTFQSVFRQVYVFPWKDINSVLIGSNSPILEKNEIVSRAKYLQDGHDFSFSLTDRALDVKIGSELAEIIPNLDKAEILTDDAPPAGYFDCWLF